MPLVRLLRRRLLALACVFAASLSTVVMAAEEDGFDLLLLEVRLNHTVLSGAIPAYERGNHVLLPLGELSRLLTIAVQTQPAQGTASGFVMSSDRSFSLNVTTAQVSRGGKFENFDPAHVLQEPDDIYVALYLLERWFPVKLSVNRPSQALEVQALEELPLQARLRREQLAERARDRDGYETRQYPHLHSPYRLLDTPFIDQTLAMEVGETNGESSSDGRYTAFATGDFLGLESSVYLTTSKQDRDPQIRATFGRHDPKGELLGPLNARSFTIGSYASPSVDNVVRAEMGEGFSISNRPLTQPTQFDSQTFEGDLPPGWDVELYYNNALIDYQQAGNVGLYRFENLPLSYGRNDFQLVFNGPLGQTRVENYSYSLDQSMARPGEFRYQLSEHRDEEGEARSLAQFDLGITRSLSASVALIRAPLDDLEAQYSSLGFRGFWQSVSLNSKFVRAEDGGQLGELGFQTRLAGVAIDGSRLFLDEFVSDEFSHSSNPIETRDKLRLSGSIPVGESARLPLTLELKRDVRASGAVDTTVSNRISAYAFRTSLTNTLDWHTTDTSEHATGSFQLSRRVYDVSMRGSIDYTVYPQREASSVALTADYNLSEGYRVSAGVSRNLINPLTSWSAGLTKSVGRFGFGLSGRYSEDGDYAVGLQFSLGMGQEPRGSRWLVDAQPMAGYGAASARLFLDENGNGIMDTGEEPLAGAGFTVDGGRREVRTGADGIAHLGRLPVRRYVDLGVDRSTLLDPQWQPTTEGVSLVPRPGHVVEVDLPVRLTSEIDGTVYLLEGHGERGIGGLELELLDEQMKVVGKTTTAWDGFYILPSVPSGTYYLRMSPEQLKRLKLHGTGVRVITVPANGDFVSGMDMLVQRSVDTAAGHPSSARTQSVASRPEPSRKRSDFDAWIDQQPANNFTIQLIAAGAEASVREFMERNGITGQSVYFESRHRGLPWYSLVSGSYETREAAQAALKALPGTLRSASPWIRQFGDVHQIRKQRR